MPGAEGNGNVKSDYRDSYPEQRREGWDVGEETLNSAEGFFEGLRKPARTPQRRGSPQPSESRLDAQ